MALEGARGVEAVPSGREARIEARAGHLLHAHAHSALHRESALHAMHTLLHTRHHPLHSWLTAHGTRTTTIRCEYKRRARFEGNGRTMESPSLAYPYPSSTFAGQT